MAPRLIQKCVSSLRRLCAAPAAIEIVFCLLLLAPFLLQRSTPSSPGQGLLLTVYRGKDLDPDRYLKTFVSSEPKISLSESIFPQDVPTTGVSMRWEGFLQIAEPGRYRIGVKVDDGMRILIDSIFLIDEWADGAERQKFATVNLDAGVHPITIDYRQATGDAVLEIYWMQPGAAQSSPIPASAFRLAQNG